MSVMIGDEGVEISPNEYRDLLTRHLIALRDRPALKVDGPDLRSLARWLYNHPFEWAGRDYVMFVRCLDEAERIHQETSRQFNREF